jgi:prepilin-type processing-associated H-X9-DG protein
MPATRLCGVALAFGIITTAAAAYPPQDTKKQTADQSKQSAANLKQIGLAMHNYHDTYGAFPPAAIADKGGKPLLSWRVAMLPFLGEDTLYKQFKLDEPWDSDNNKKLLGEMPKIYMTPGVNNDKDSETYYQVFVGAGAAFGLLQGTKLPAITDGTSNTLMVATAEKAVPWTKPDDMVFEPAKGVPKLGFFHNETANVLFCDGAVRSLKKSIAPATLKAMITRAGGEQFEKP